MYIDNLFLKAVKQIAEENPEGFTLDLRNMELVSSGIVAAYQDTQNSFGSTGLLVCIKHALYHDGFIGGWRNPNGKMQYDSCQIFEDLKEAIKFGRNQKQYAIFDIDNGWEIIL